MSNVAVLVGPDYEDSELDIPVAALRVAGHQVTMVGGKAGEKVRGKKGESSTIVDVASADAHAADYGAVLIPGGYSPDHLRTNEAVVNFLEDAIRANSLVAAVCHGPSLLIEADACRGVRLTSWPSIRKDLVNAGAHWEDKPVVIDGKFITSRNPSDLPAFSTAVLEALS
jgi:protease I